MKPLTVRTKGRRFFVVYMAQATCVKCGARFVVTNPDREDLDLGQDADQWDEFVRHECPGYFAKIGRCKPGAA